jgi:hypothetical protein
MPILATVNYGKSQFTKSWDFYQNDQEAYLVLHEASDGKIVIPLENHLIQNTASGLAAPKRFYAGNVNAADAIALLADEKSP